MPPMQDRHRSPLAFPSDTSPGLAPGRVRRVVRRGPPTRYHDDRLGFRRGIPSRTRGRRQHRFRGAGSGLTHPSRRTTRRPPAAPGSPGRRSAFRRLAVDLPPGRLSRHRADGDRDADPGGRLGPLLASARRAAGPRRAGGQAVNRQRQGVGQVVVRLSTRAAIRRPPPAVGAAETPPAGAGARDVRQDDRPLGQQDRPAVSVLLARQAAGDPDDAAPGQLLCQGLARRRADAVGLAEDGQLPPRAERLDPADWARRASRSPPRGRAQPAGRWSRSRPAGPPARRVGVPLPPQSRPASPGRRRRRADGKSATAAIRSSIGSRRPPSRRTRPRTRRGTAAAT